MKNPVSNQIKTRMTNFSREIRDFLLDYMNEAQTRKALVEPFLEILGYSFHDVREVSLEYRDGKGKPVDYAIMDDCEPSIFIEAKTHHTTIDHPKIIDQALGYGNRTVTVDFVALTNGESWMWFKRPEFDIKVGKRRKKFEKEPFFAHNILKPTDDAIPFLNAIKKGNYNGRKAYKIAAGLESSTATLDTREGTFSTETLWIVEASDVKRELSRELNEDECAWRRKNGSKWKIYEDVDGLADDIVCFLASRHKDGVDDFFKRAVERSRMITKVPKRDERSLKIKGKSTGFALERKWFGRGYVRQLGLLANFILVSKRGRLPLREYVEIRVPNPHWRADWSSPDFVDED